MKLPHTIICILISLISQLNTLGSAPSDTLRQHTETLIKKAQLASDNPQKSYDLAQKAVQYATQINDIKLQGEALLVLTKISTLLSKSSEAIRTANRAIEIFTELNDSTNLAKSYNAKGICYLRRAQYGKAIQNFRETLTISTKINDSLILASAYNNLGIAYAKTKQLQDAKSCYAKSSDIYRGLGELKHAATAEANIGIIHLEEGNFEIANQNFNAALKLNQKLQDTLKLASMYDNLGKTQEKLGEYKQSIAYYTLSNQYYRKLNSDYGIALSSIALARVKLALGQNAQAYNNLIEGQKLAIKNQEEAITMESYKLLSDYYLKAGKHSLSREMLQKYVDLFEKNYSEEVASQIAKLQVQIDTLQQEHDFKLLSAKLEMQELEAEQNNRIKSFYIQFIVILLILLSITALLAIKLRNKNLAIKRFNKQLFNFNNELEVMVKNRTEELSIALEKVQELGKVKSAFMNNISHEIRTPLNGIIGFSQYIASHEATADERELYNNQIQKLGAQLLRIVDDILELSRIETNQISTQLADTNINSLLNDLYQEYSHNDDLLKKKLHFRLIKSLPDSEATFNLDTYKVKRIISNLIENALKFTHTGSIEFGYFAESNSTIKFFVKDTGIGIPQTVQKLVFEKFFKHIADDHIAKYNGTGIGLTIAKGYALSMGGRIEMDSKPDTGSTFFFYMPKLTPQNTPNPKASTKNRWANKTILVVEDDLINFHYIKALMQQTGVRLIHVKNAEDAIDVCTINTNINLILIDIQLPFMNGIEATRIIRKKNATIPIIAQSANSPTNGNAEYIEAGCNAFISKPIDPDELFAQIDQHMS
ncbi:MAG: tetratricopeptide repeat protein [Bacteroidales bacterium]|nr:tetratricopeptide repeat protein [Bacteroidales bacterium]